jgi:hypothetical protein
MDTAPALRTARERLACQVREALGQVPPEIAGSAVGHAVLAETLVQIAADIVGCQGHPGLLDRLVRRSPGPPLIPV